MTHRPHLRLYSVGRQMALSMPVFAPSVLLHLVFLQGKVNSARYIALVVNPVLLPFLRQEGDVLFQQDNTHTHRAAAMQAYIAACKLSQTCRMSSCDRFSLAYRTRCRNWAMVVAGSGERINSHFTVPHTCSIGERSGDLAGQSSCTPRRARCIATAVFGRALSC